MTHSGSAVTVASAQYIFTSTSNFAVDENSINDSSSHLGADSNSRGASNANSRTLSRNSSTSSLNRFSAKIGDGGKAPTTFMNSELFNQLAAKNASSLKRSTSIIINK